MTRQTSQIETPNVFRRRADMTGKKLSLLALTVVLLAGCTHDSEIFAARSAGPGTTGPSGPAYRETSSLRESAPGHGPAMARILHRIRGFGPSSRRPWNNNRDLRVAALNVERARAFTASSAPSFARRSTRRHGVRATRCPRTSPAPGTRPPSSSTASIWASAPGRSTSSAGFGAWKSGRWRNTSPRNRPAAAPRSC